MQWVGVIGSWRAKPAVFEKRVRQHVRAIFARGDGLLTVGAAGAGAIALDEALKNDPDAERIKIFLEAPFKLFTQHYAKRAAQGIIPRDRAMSLVSQVAAVRARHPEAIVETQGISFIDKDTYLKRNTALVGAADALIVFRVFSDDSVGAGSSDAIDKATAKGIPVQVFDNDVRSKRL